MAVVIFYLLITAVTLVFGDEIKKTEKSAGKQSVLLKIRLDSEIKGKKDTMSPEVLTLSGRKAFVVVARGNDSGAGKKTKGVMETDTSSEEFLMTLDVTPEIIPDTNPAEIKINATFHLNRYGSEITRTFQYVITDGGSFVFRMGNDGNSDRIALTVQASVAELPKSGTANN